MNVYAATHTDRGYCGAPDIVLCCVVVADTEKEALGLCLEYLDDSRVYEWEINQVDQSIKKVYDMDCI